VSRGGGKELCSLGGGGLLLSFGRGKRLERQGGIISCVRGGGRL